jgi:hypothetical protein
MLLYMGGEPTDYVQSRWAFKEGLQEFGPESFSTLQRCVKEECLNPSLKVRVRQRVTAFKMAPHIASRV